MIRDRRKSQIKGNRSPKKVSQVERSIATSRAKRDAAIKVKRGLSKNKKAHNKLIDQEVKRHDQRSAVAKRRSEKNFPGGLSRANGMQKKSTQRIKNDNTPETDVVFGGK